MKITENFDSNEFKCKCGKCDLEIDKAYVLKLQLARDLAKVSFKILSGCRCKEHNAKVGGKPNSAHLRCLASDIETNPKTKDVILAALRQAGFKRIGIANNFIHCDIDKTLPQVEWKY